MKINLQLWHADIVIDTDDNILSYLDKTQDVGLDETIEKNRQYTLDRFESNEGFNTKIVLDTDENMQMTISII